MSRALTYASRLAGLFADPRQLGALDAGEWDMLVRVCRRANLLAKLAESAHAAGTEALPAAVADTLDGALTLSRRQERAIHWEIACLREALADTGIPLVLLKGAAYLARGLGFSKGRLYSDVDIIVPLDSILEVESALMKAGWATTHHDAYDQRYYRQWMHEIPPMKHWQRGTVVDVHHRILPRTSRYDPDPARMLASARPVDALPGVFTLDALDMLLHSATHLFHEGEFDHGFRDLLDIDGLYRHLATEADFLPRLQARAQQLNLTEPLALALRYAQRIVGTPVDPALPAIATARPLLDALFERALHPHHPRLDTAGAPAARLALYIRAHWLRMPPHLLGQHLSRKAWKRLFPDPEETLEVKKGA
jgi:hypothetical protein